MRTDPSDPVSAEGRLARLERANRNLGALFGALLILLGAGVLVGAALLEDELKASRFFLTAAGDRGEAELAYTDKGMPRLSLKDRDGKPRVELVLDAEGRPSLGLLDRDGRSRARLFLGDDERPSLVFYDAAGKAVRTETASAAPPAAEKPAEEKRVMVEFKTSLGDFVVELNAEKAPITVENFLQYVDDKFYDGTIFHRVIPNFMVQGGGFTEEMSPFSKDTRPPIRIESQNGLKNVRGAIAMARTNDPDSATSQFFINVVDNPNLDYRSGGAPGYAVFGKVVKGMDVVDKIRNTKTENKGGPYVDAPVETVVIKSVRRVEKQ
jgi:peptidyl-prolyl cis-trans isomerase A (cyclophilin A)